MPFLLRRNSVFRYKGTALDPKKVASELGVQAILTGRVVQRGDQLALSVELIDPLTENTIWGRKYDRKISDLVSLQSEIATDVSSKLRLKLSGTDFAKLNKTYTSNSEAYELYLKGRYHATKYTEDGFNKGIEYFTQAIEMDPTYALAYDGLAYCYYGNWYLPPREAYIKGKAAAKKALELDPMLASAHTSLAAIYAWYDYDWTNAEKEFRLSLELDPNYAMTHAFYGAYLVALKRYDQAVIEAKRAVELEPLSAEYNTFAGLVFYYARRYDEAAEQLTKTVEFEPNFWWAHAYLGRAEAKRGQLERAIQRLERARQLKGATAEVFSSLGQMYAASGDPQRAREVIAELKQFPKTAYGSNYALALIYSRLGDKDEAISYLEREYQSGGWFLDFLNVDPEVDPLRDEPRFKDLLRKLGFRE